VNSAPERVTVELQIDTDSHTAPRYLGLSSVAQVSLEYLLPPDHARLIESLLEVADRPRVGVPADEGVYLWVLPADVKALARLSALPAAPVSVHIDQLAPQDFQWDLVRRIGAAERAVVHWTDCWWAPVPEAGVPGDAKHAGVVVSVNSTGLWELAAAPAGFRVYLETRQGVDELVQWIAEQVRRPVIGPPEY
jgi:hypothetical protein